MALQAILRSAPWGFCITMKETEKAAQVLNIFNNSLIMICVDDKSIPVPNGSLIFLVNLVGAILLG